MASNAYIKLVPSSEKESVTTDELKELFIQYKQVITKTGKQVDWEFEEAAFPYEIKDNKDEKDKWFYLQSNKDRYHLIMLGLDKEIIYEEDGSNREQAYIQITLPESSTCGDKGKANEFSRYLAEKLKGELHLFNGRIMYFYPRK